MKPFTTCFAILFSMLLLGSTLGFLGCQREDVKPAEDQAVPAGQPGKYRHIIQLNDGGNSLTLAVSSDNEAALADYESSVTLKARTSVEIPESAVESTLEVPDDAPQISEKNAVYISKIASNLQPGMKGFDLQLNQNPTNGKVDAYENHPNGGGPFYMLSGARPHEFYLRVKGSDCVRLWIQFNYLGIWMNDGSTGGSTGRLICGHNSTYYYYNNSISNQCRLKAQGTAFEVTYY